MGLNGSFWKAHFDPFLESILRAAGHLWPFGLIFRRIWAPKMGQKWDLARYRCFGGKNGGFTGLDFSSGFRQKARILRIRLKWGLIVAAILCHSCAPANPTDQSDQDTSPMYNRLKMWPRQRFDFDLASFGHILRRLYIGDVSWSLWSVGPAYTVEWHSMAATIRPHFSRILRSLGFWRNPELKSGLAASLSGLNPALRRTQIEVRLDWV